jgi:hypothetical protein
MVIVHQHESRGKGYAFAYDDVTADDAPNASGLLSDPKNSYPRESFTQF